MRHWLLFIALLAASAAQADEKLVVTTVTDRHGNECRVAHTETVSADDALNTCVHAQLRAH
jgi:hypothetical protein